MVYLVDKTIVNVFCLGDRGEVRGPGEDEPRELSDPLLQGLGQGAAVPGGSRYRYTSSLWYILMQGYKLCIVPAKMF